ncbi:methyltransferase domain-containing protein [Mycolicibacterium sp.]|uniref:class I SAM-dependent methyltransferase n=1 Tax=Mycolicibacterium sp. TaxID=2320850 RepID=UPI001A27DB35|nr:methyltransferase domain-containing protein [Mycolicibacterium sp.]MBJ7336736.1 methyltransferase domain-containing protein [Mycolicibacterium sp.]
MRLLSPPRPHYVQQCRSCLSAFFHFGAAKVVSHNDQYTAEVAYQRYLEAANQTSCTQRYAETLTQLRGILSDVEQPSIFDIGAGGGDFLAMARDRGFRIAGNEVSPPAIEACRERHGIDLTLGDDLFALAEKSPGYDAVTMWCVLAHVDEPEDLLRGARALLRPGGILFFSTPRYCAIDRAALTIRRLTRDRYRRVFDRRINHLHRRQYSQRGMDALLRRERFTPIAVDPAIGYGLRMEQYLHAVGFPRILSEPVGTALERSATAGLAPRNILNVYARATKD